MATPTRTAAKPVENQRWGAPTAPSEAAQLPTVTAHAGGRVAPLIPTSFAEIAQIASAVHSAGMAPRSLDTPQKLTVAMMHGLEIGMTPMVAIQSIAVINNMPALYGDGLLGLVRSSGLLEDLQEGVDVDKNGNPIRAWCKVKRHGEASWKERELTWADCQKAGWTGKSGPWTAVPKRMMTIRVRGWLLRDTFADVLKGLRSAEEVEDMVDVGSASLAPVEEPKRSDYHTAQNAGASQTIQDIQASNNTASAGPPPAEGSAHGGAFHGAQGGAGPGGEAPPNVPPHDPETGEITGGELGMDGDVDESEPLVFDRYQTPKQLVEFSEGWLDDPSRTPAEARAWEAFYREDLAKMAKHTSAKVQEAAALLIALYSAVISREQQGQ